MSKAPSRWSVLAALAAIYLIWGSTYLAIRWAVETIPLGHHPSEDEVQEPSFDFRLTNRYAVQ